MEIIKEILELTKELLEKDARNEDTLNKLVVSETENKELQLQIGELKEQIGELKEQIREANTEATPAQSAILTEKLASIYRVDETSIKSYYDNRIKTNNMTVYDWTNSVFNDNDLEKIYSSNETTEFVRYEMKYGLKLPKVEAYRIGNVKEVFAEEYKEYLKAKEKEDK